MSGQNNNEHQPTWKPTRMFWITVAIILLIIVIGIGYFESDRIVRLLNIERYIQKNEITAVQETNTTELKQQETSSVAVSPPPPGFLDNDYRDKEVFVKALQTIPFKLEKVYVFKKVHAYEADVKKYLHAVISNGKHKIVLIIELNDNDCLIKSDRTINSFIRKLRGRCIWFKEQKNPYLYTKDDENETSLDRTLKHNCWHEAIIEHFHVEKFEIDGSTLSGKIYTTPCSFTWIEAKQLQTNR